MTSASAETLPTKLRDFAADIKLGHSVFALPWAVLATFLAAQTLGRRLPTPGQLALIVLCMVLARTVAMAANRLLDAALDARNPRTAGRALPSGRLRPRFVLIVAVLCGGAFVAATSLFGFVYANWLPLTLSVPVLLFVSAYPLLKRFTRWVHYYLGAALGLAPVCAWIAIAGSLDWPVVVMGVAVLLWTAGFDILYACQDRDVDVRDGLHSLPARLGIAPALWLARTSHLACVALLLWLKWLVPQFGPLYLAACVLVLVLLVSEHLLVRADDLSRINLAFFTLNGCVSLTLGILGVIDVAW